MALTMSEKPSGIAHHAVIHHWACISLSLHFLSLTLSISTAVDTTHHAIVAITVPATTIISLQTSLQGQALYDKL